MKETFIKIIDTLIGPTLDRLGSQPTDETWISPNVSASTLVDKQTGQSVGQEIYAIRDGVASIKTFDRPTTLRQRAQNYLDQKLNPKL